MMKHLLVFAPLALICFGFGLTGFDDAGHRKKVNVSNVAAAPDSPTKISAGRMAYSVVSGKVHKSVRKPAGCGT